MRQFMIYQNDVIKLFPKKTGLKNIFFSSPVSPTLYGNVHTSQIILSSNNKNEILKYKNEDKTVLAIDTGGFPLNAAIAFNCLKYKNVILALKQLDTMKDYSFIVSKQLLEKTSISKIITIDKISAPKKYNEFLIRLFYGIRLSIGQGLIISIPLMFFSLNSLLISAMSMFISGVFLSLIWTILPNKNFFKGIISGFILSIFTFAFGYYFVNLDFILFVKLTLILFICSSWMGLIFSGTKY